MRDILADAAASPHDVVDLDTHVGLAPAVLEAGCVVVDGTEQRDEIVADPGACRLRPRRHVRTPPHVRRGEQVLAVRAGERGIPHGGQRERGQLRQPWGAVSTVARGDRLGDEPDLRLDLVEELVEPEVEQLTDVTLLQRGRRAAGLATPPQSSATWARAVSRQYRTLRGRSGSSSRNSTTSTGSIDARSRRR